MKPLFYAALLLILLQGCRRRCHEVACPPGGLGPIELHGFDSLEMQGIVMRQYDTATGFTRLLQTVHCDQIVRDTVDSVVHTLISCGPLAGYNWEIYFPNVPKTARIDRIANYLRVEQECDDEQVACTSPYERYYQDDTLHRYQPPQRDHSDAVQVYR